jgi:glycosyltransferase involved in cell wall biosynthesis
VSGLSKKLWGWLQRYERVARSIARVLEIRVRPLNRITYTRPKQAPASGNIESDPRPIGRPIVIDAQCLQTANRQRGIGRYTLGFIDAMCEQVPNQSVIVLLTNIADPAEIQRARILLDSLGRPNLVLHLVNLFDEGQSKISRVNATKMLIGQVEKLNPEMVITASVFEPAEETVLLPATLRFPHVAILYDLIPLEFPADLLYTRKRRARHRELVGHLSSFHELFAISQHAKETYLRKVDPSKEIVVIGGGTAARGSTEDKGLTLRKGLLIVGAEQKHKNIDRAVLAYAKLPERLRLEHRLTIVGIRASGINKRLRKLVQRYNVEIEIAGYLPDNKLEDLYNQVRLVVIPSLAEGLGLPVLEAWSHQGVAIGAYGTAVGDLIGNQEALFDPYSEGSMAAVIEKILTNEVLWMKLQEAGAEKLKVNSWNEVAARALNGVRLGQPGIPSKKTTRHPFEETGTE